MIVRGSSLCGAVGDEARLPSLRFVNCHCSRCRKTTGSAYAANALVSPEAFRWTRGEGEAAHYDLPEARSFAAAFCRRCGSPLPHFTRSGREVIVPGGSPDSDPGERPSAHVHWGSRANWFSMSTGDLPLSDPD